MTITSNNPRLQKASSVTHSLLRLLNGKWHKPAMQVFIFVIIAHWLEHIFQAAQVWVLGWSRSEALGFLGLFYPWLIKSEWLHYGHALFMLLGLAVLRPSMVGRARLWWDITLFLQFFHHLEHALLLGQVLIHKNLFDSPIPISIGQIWFPRIELHLFYNTIVTIPMLIAIYDRRYPTDGERKVTV